MWGEKYEGRGERYGHGRHGGQCSGDRGDRRHHEEGSEHSGRGGGGHGPHPGMGRRGGGSGGGRARRGESKYLLMDALRDAPKHGYEIIKSLEERSGGQYAPSPGVVYPTLQFLAEAGLVRAEQDGDRRIFHLTDAGQGELDAYGEEVALFWSRFASPTGAAARAEIGFVEEELEYLTRAVRGGLRGDPDASLVRQVRQAIEACRGEVRRLVAEASEENPS